MLLFAAPRESELEEYLRERPHCRVYKRSVKTEAHKGDDDGAAREKSQMMDVKFEEDNKTEANEVVTHTNMPETELDIPAPATDAAVQDTVVCTPRHCIHIRLTSLLG